MIRLSRPDSKNKLTNILLPLAAIALCVIFQAGNSNFFTAKNWTNIGRQQASLLVAAVGQTFVILTGCIDLSQGSMVGLVSVLSADIAIRYGFPAAVLASILLGVVVGVSQGFLVAKLRIPAFIVGLGFMNVLRGAAQLYCNGMPISGLPDIYSKLGADSFLGLPIPLIVAVVLMFIGWGVLRRLTVGRNVYAVGGNEEASRLAGIDVVRVRMFVYIVSGILTAIAGVLQTSRVSVGQCTLGEGLQMQAIAAAVIGGTSMSGGQGSCLKTVLGVLIMAIISNGLNLLRVSSYTQTVINGAIIIIAVAIDVMGKKRRA